MFTLIAMIMYFLNIFFMKKMFLEREKMIPLECGFNMMNKNLLPFSIQFYYMAILFLIFDIEISLMLPMIQKLYYFFLNKWLILFTAISLILIFGLILEWWKNLIKWDYY
uniref:NADH-ubiquinone oxidoreductase chain 3 n=1 Tax=Idris sp. MM-2013 TaxID=1429433 RepID=A0A067YFN7_9HYME|nr:NADH dehydrogenase subunit 3 [Idris sp. MM-2013]